MDSSIVKVTAKGQISIPKSFQDALSIEKGNELLLLMQDDTITIKKVKEADFKDLLVHSQKVANKLWSSSEDDVWDEV